MVMDRARSLPGCLSRHGGQDVALSKWWLESFDFLLIQVSRPPEDSDEDDVLEDQNGRYPPVPGLSLFWLDSWMLVPKRLKHKDCC